jgi:hypothetical protein
MQAKSTRLTTTTNSAKVLAKVEAPPTDDAEHFVAFADSVAPRYIVGDLLRFGKGDFTVGDGEVFPIGTMVVPVMDWLLDGFVLWRAGKPVEHAMIRVATGAKPPKRAELGDNDPAHWETDSSGEKRDPWARSVYLPMVVFEAGRLLTFTTSSAGGRGAVAELARMFGNHHRQQPSDYPVTKLEVDSYLHRVREFGRIKVPRFKLWSYIDRPRYEALLAKAGLGEAPAGEETVKTLPIVEFGRNDSEDPSAGMTADFDDDVPYCF